MKQDFRRAVANPVGIINRLAQAGERHRLGLRRGHSCFRVGMDSLALLGAEAAGKCRFEVDQIRILGVRTLE
jgi:hypothetical protein